MKVSTPSICWHSKKRVSSVDFQPVNFPVLPEGQQRVRLASSGDDEHVVIWEVVSDEKGKLEPKFLCDLNRHQSAVNIVRWSKDGQMLASGDNDYVTIIWKYSEQEDAPDIFGEDKDDKETNRENWVHFKTLRGHIQDVVGLEFSPCGQFLVTCSTDQNAMIFDVVKGQKLKALDEHKSWVNGVAWDPLNKFISTICSDRILRVYSNKPYKLKFKTHKAKLSLGVDANTGERTEEKNVRLFHDDTFQSFYRRLAFSPDGELLVVPSGVLEVDGETDVLPCTYVFSRLNFNTPVLYLPNKEQSVAVRFSPVLYKLRKNPLPKSDKPVENGTDSEPPTKPWEEVETLFCLPYRMIYAIATKMAILFYDTQQAEPFARVSNIHYVGLNDLSWSADGTTLVVSSTDGWCSLVTFKQEELGEIYEKTEEAKENEKKAEDKTEKADNAENALVSMESSDKIPTEAPPATLIAVKRAPKAQNTAAAPKPMSVVENGS